MSSTLVKERAETNRRVAMLNKQKEIEELRKEELVCERELTELARPSIREWMKKLFGIRR